MDVKLSGAPIHCAFQDPAHIEVARLLIERGANLNIPDRVGPILELVSIRRLTCPDLKSARTPLHYAVLKEFPLEMVLFYLLTKGQT
jgi:hypothetical protein